MTTTLIPRTPIVPSTLASLKENMEPKRVSSRPTRDTTSVSLPQKVTKSPTRPFVVDFSSTSSSDSDSSAGSPTVSAASDNLHFIDASFSENRIKRRIKNRESAQMWREKRKRKMQDLESENKKLSVERDHLLERVSRIEQQNIAMQNQLLELKMLLTSNAFTNRQPGFFATLTDESQGEARPGVLPTLEGCTSLGKPKALVLDGTRTISSPFGHRPTFLALFAAAPISQQSRLVLLVQTVWYRLVSRVLQLVRILIWQLCWIGKTDFWSQKFFMHKF